MQKKICSNVYLMIFIHVSVNYESASKKSLSAGVIPVVRIIRKQKHERFLNLYSNRYRMNYGQRISVKICKMVDSQILVPKIGNVSRHFSMKKVTKY